MGEPGGIMRTSIIILAASLTLTACQGVVGSGTTVTQAREVGAFRKVNISAGLTAHVTTGARSVTLVADDNLAPLIETVVQDDTFIARFKQPTSVVKATRLELTIVNDVLEGVIASGAATVTAAATPATEFPVIASGASDVAISGLSVTKLSVDASGAAQVTVSGAGTSESLSASGASSIDAKRLPVQAATLDVSGASDVRAAVSGTLSGSVSGASTVTITGTPTGDVSITGASTLTKGAP
jgi:hypothetical protein